MVYLKKKKNKIFLIIVIILLFILAGVRLSKYVLKTVYSPLPTLTVKIAGQAIMAEAVNDTASEYRGLSDRASLCATCGMLFMFNDAAPREFVMRNMEFPLDIIFINQHKIIKIAANLPPEGESPKIIYASDGSADAVLEVNAGYTTKHNLKIGDYVEY